MERKNPADTVFNALRRKHTQNSMFAQSINKNRVFFTMSGGFIRKEPSDYNKLWETPEVVDLFSRAHWMTFCDKLQGHDDEITEEFLRSLKLKSKTLAIVNFRGLTLRLTPHLISRVTDLPMGVPWDKEERKLGQKVKKEFFFPEEQFSEDKNGVGRTSL